MRPAPSHKPWYDENDCDEVFFASIHGYGGGFYPGSGRTLYSAKNRHCPEIVNVGVSVGRDGCSSGEFRRRFTDEVTPKLLRFKPDLLFISAGFDGHSDDLIGQCKYKDADFAWVTEQLMSIANITCKGKVVSVLEGGYNTRAGYMSPFARSVRQHVRTLMNHDVNVKPDTIVQMLPGEKERREMEAYVERVRAIQREQEAEIQMGKATLLMDEENDQYDMQNQQEDNDAASSSANLGNHNAGDVEMKPASTEEAKAVNINETPKKEEDNHNESSKKRPANNEGEPVVEEPSPKRVNAWNATADEGAADGW